LAVAGDRVEARLAALRAENPEWGAWLDLLRELAAALARDWSADCRVAPGARPPDAPLLDGATVTVDGRAVERMLREFFGAVGLDGYRPSGAEAVALLDRAIEGSPELQVAVAERAGWSAGALAAVVSTALAPILHAARDQLEAATPVAERPVPLGGFCPVCGAWPILAEVRGLDRSRWLRCGRCGAAWEFTWLRCPFCGEADHERLRSLVPEVEDGGRRIETCLTCRGYLLSVQTLGALPSVELLLADAEAIELDIAAEGRGFRRPAAGAGARVRIVAREGR
jgi:FdhE protein